MFDSLMRASNHFSNRVFRYRSSRAKQNQPQLTVVAANSSATSDSSSAPAVSKHSKFSSGHAGGGSALTVNTMAPGDQMLPTSALFSPPAASVHHRAGAFLFSVLPRNIHELDVKCKLLDESYAATLSASAASLQATSASSSTSSSSAPPQLQLRQPSQEESSASTPKSDADVERVSSRKQNVSAAETLHAHSMDISADTLNTGTAMASAVAGSSLSAVSAVSHQQSSLLIHSNGNMTWTTLLDGLDASARVQDADLPAPETSVGDKVHADVIADPTAIVLPLVAAGSSALAFAAPAPKSISATSAVSSASRSGASSSLSSSSHVGSAFGPSAASGLSALDPWLGSLVAPLSLTNGAVYLVYRFTGFWRELFKCNPVSLGNAPVVELKYRCTGERPFSDIIRDAASFLDDLRVVRMLEAEDERIASKSSSHRGASSALSASQHPASPLHKMAVHIEVAVLWMLAHAVTRVREARRRRAIKFLVAHNFKQIALGMKLPSALPRYLVSFFDTVRRTTWEGRAFDDFNIDPDALYSQAIFLALNGPAAATSTASVTPVPSFAAPSAGRFDIGTGAANAAECPSFCMPRRSLPSLALKVMFANAHDETEVWSCCSALLPSCRFWISDPSMFLFSR